MIQEIRERLKNSMRLRFCAVLFLWATVLGLAAVLRGNRFLPEDTWLICWNDSGSVPRGIYLRVPIGMPAEGDYVVFLPNELSKRFSVARGWSKPEELWLKQIGALPGGIYSVHCVSLQFFANGRYVGQAALRDSEDRPMPELRGEYTVPEGEFLPVGSNPRSFDGRYTGTVPLTHIRAKVIPLLTGF